MATSVMFSDDGLPMDDTYQGRIFRRYYWKDDKPDLMFTWHRHERCYSYCDVNRKGKIKFRTYGLDGRERVSRVGRSVLNAGDLVDITDEVMKKETKMANVNFIGGEYNVVKVTYDLDAVDPIGAYTFKIDPKIAITIGDMLVVEASNGFGLVRVVEYLEKALDSKTIKEFNKATAWVVDKVDETAQTARREASERKKFIMQQLKEKKEQMEEVAIYQILASQDEDAAKMIKELENLNKGVIDVETE